MGSSSLLSPILASKFRRPPSFLIKAAGSRNRTQIAAFEAWLRAAIVCRQPSVSDLTKPSRVFQKCFLRSLSHLRGPGGKPACICARCVRIGVRFST